jgi:hypothetical protein
MCKPKTGRHIDMTRSERPAMMQKRFKDLYLVQSVWKCSELLEMITVKMQPQTESCFTRTIFIEKENSVKNVK